MPFTDAYMNKNSVTGSNSNKTFQETDLAMKSNNKLSWNKTTNDIDAWI